MSTHALPTDQPSIPRVKGLPVLGSLAEFRRDPLVMLETNWREHGDLYNLKLGPREIYVASNPALAEEILVSGKADFVKPKRPDGKPVGLQLVLEDGLLTNPDNESWLRQRRMMQPMFHRARIAEMCQKMTDAGEKLIAGWDADYDEQMTVDLHREMLTVTMDIINRTMFSVDMDEVVDFDEISHAVEVAINFIVSRQRSLIRPPLNLPTRNNRQFEWAKAKLDELVYGIIAERRAEGTHRGDLLDMLIDVRDEETGQGMTDRQIRNEVATIFGAGHETTANALTWTWYVLAQRRDLLSKLQDEVDYVLEGRVPTMDDLPKLPYTLAVFQEAMRLYPPVPFTFRVTTAPAKLDGYTIPGGVGIVVMIHNIHRHPSYWQHAETFEPERWLSKHDTKQPRYAYIPFGAGPHLCIGNHFALIEGQLLLAMIAQHYDMKLMTNVPVKKIAAITLRPQNGLPVRLQRRQ